MKIITIPLILFLGLAISYCTGPSGNKAATTHPAEVKQTDIPDFNADSAYAYVKKQVDFGPRVPNTAAHDRCAAWLVSKLKGFSKE
ncbi:MAG TPA: hypothetical protein VMC08_00315, partial [Bacteroidales bacterium]|nr:hypothetical protein [Bacteroidales bacterium]